MTCAAHPDRPVHAHGVCRRCYDSARGKRQVAGEGKYRALPTAPAEPGEIPVIFRDYSHLDKLHLYPLGDVHKGAASHAEGTWRGWLAYLEQTPHASLLGTGDFLNAALKDSVSDVYEERYTVGSAKRAVRDELRPLADDGRVDLLLPGNHEDRITKAIGDCPILDIAEQLDVPYAEAAALLVVTVGDQEYELYVRHGTGNGQSLTALFKGDDTVPTADVFITGHTHRQAVVPGDFMVREGSRLVRRHRYYVSSGSFLGLERYAVQRGYAPTRLGAPRIRLDGRARDIHVSV